MRWMSEYAIDADWRKISLRPLITFKVTLLSGTCDMCFGLIGAYHNSIPRKLEVSEPRYSATSEYECYLYLRGKGKVRVEEVEEAA
jgi:hypothetical protein